MGARRTATAHAYPGETVEGVTKAIAKRRDYTIISTDPLNLGTGAFGVHGLDAPLILKVTDVTRKGWVLFIERRGGQSV